MIIFYKLPLNGVVSLGQGYALPDGAVEITEPEYLAELDASREPEAETLAQSKDRLKQLVDTKAETERLKYITGGVGQAMTYQQKSAEALNYLSATNPDAADYPLLSAEVGTTGETLADVATIIKTAFEQWQMIGAAIEKVRLSAKKAISEAETSEAAQAVFDAVIWPSV
ncbi:hypothetical protein [Rhizobium sp.]|jgi:hypothetical protein|uniref:hypothetical protein n=1 Tax=Rhizobium sp. TaxID=391 RepID=UPI000E98EF91|nr:hypothetical protein [Rhizobium sp.]